MATDNPETHNLDAEKGGGYDYDQSEAQLQAFSDKAVSTKKPSLSKGTQRQTVTMYIRNEGFSIVYFNCYSIFALYRSGEASFGRCMESLRAR